jgi:hypothetical protein
MKGKVREIPQGRFVNCALLNETSRLYHEEGLREAEAFLRRCQVIKSEDRLYGFVEKCVASRYETVPVALRVISST